jgi:hypothetical protein
MGEWMPELSIRRELCLVTENTPYVEFSQIGWLREVMKECDEENHTQGSEADDSEAIEEEPMVRNFLRGDDRYVCLPQADKVEAFCRGCISANLESLREGSAGEGLHPVAWVVDRSCEGARPDRGPLTARDLYRYLKEPVRCRDSKRQKPT